MPFKHVLITASRGLRTHLTRSLLTILGIVIGIAAIIMVTSLGQGAQNLIVDQISGIGPETVIIRPGGDHADMASLFTETIVERDLAALERQQNVPNLRRLEPFVMVSTPLKYQGEQYSPTMMGGSAEFMADMIDIKLGEGAYYTKSDIEQQARVVVLGYDVRQDLFGNGRAVGEQVQLGDSTFKVVGVFAESGSVAGFDIDNTLMLPHTTAAAYITGQDFYQEVYVMADDVANVDKMAYDIERTLRQEHKLKFGEANDFSVETQAELLEQINTVISIFTSFLIAVVSISLVVGGIGIMNIMLVSVSERTTEIGLRKALGARGRDIRMQFLVEAVILTSIGGVIGVVVGSAVSLGISVVLDQTVMEGWRFAFPVLGATLGVVVSASVGLLFGIYPATQAAKKSPIEALRYE